jgi:large subunit ribosomal protein L6
MSKIGNTPITIPDKVKIEIDEAQQQVTVIGPNGELAAPLHRGISVELDAGQIRVSRSNDKIQTKAYHGLVRSLLQNHIQGVTEGYSKTLKLVGTGYRVKKQGAGLEMTLGFSHPVSVEAVDGIELDIEGNDTIFVKGIDKQKVGQIAAEIRALRPPEPYKGKGIRYEGEVVKLKPGKAAVE